MNMQQQATIDQSQSTRGDESLQHRDPNLVNGVQRSSCMFAGSRPTDDPVVLPGPSFSSAHPLKQSSCLPRLSTNSSLRYVQEQSQQPHWQVDPEPSTPGSLPRDASSCNENFPRQRIPTGRQYASSDRNRQVPPGYYGYYPTNEQWRFIYQQQQQHVVHNTGYPTHSLGFEANNFKHSTNQASPDCMKVSSTTDIGQPGSKTPQTGGRQGDYFKVTSPHPSSQHNTNSNSNYYPFNNYWPYQQQCPNFNQPHHFHPHHINPNHPSIPQNYYNHQQHHYYYHHHHHQQQQQQQQQQQRTISMQHYPQQLQTTQQQQQNMRLSSLDASLMQLSAENDLFASNMSMS